MPNKSKRGTGYGRGVDVVAYETYTGTAPRRQEKPLPCGCAGRCEPEDAEPSRIGHGGRCAQKLNPYAAPNAGAHGKEFAICSPCFGRMINIGVDIHKLKSPGKIGQPKPKKKGGTQPDARVPGLRREMESRNMPAVVLVNMIPMLENNDHVYKLRQLRRGARPDLMRALAQALGCKKDDLLRGD